MADVIKILSDMGYRFTDDGEYLRMTPLYRSSDNPTSLQVHKINGNFKDWSTNESGSLALLIKKTLNIPFSEVYKILGGETASEAVSDVDRAERLSDNVIETFSLKSVGTLLPHHKSFLDRKISLETLELFKGGVAMGGYMRNRYTFPIYDEEGNIIGFSGRAIRKNMLPKWKNKGKTRNWIYPLFLNEKEILDSRKVFLVESIGDMLSLWECGVRNVLVLFGIRISKKVISRLIELNPKEIVVSLNNEPDNNNIGNDAAKNIAEKLSCFFDEVSVSLPFSGDFSDMLMRGELKDWIKIYG